jgi:HK97 gp10 family phage protein
MIKIIETDILNGVDKGDKKSVTVVAAKIASQAKQLAPVAIKNGGRLKGSIGYKVDGQETANPKLSINVKKSDSKYEGFVGSAVDYAIYQEFGTRKMKAQPFLVPAVEIVKGANLVEAIKTAMNSEIVKAIAKKRITKL